MPQTFQSVKANGFRNCKAIKTFGTAGEVYAFSLRTKYTKHIMKPLFSDEPVQTASAS